MEDKLTLDDALVEHHHQRHLAYPNIRAKFAILQLFLVMRCWRYRRDVQGNRFFFLFVWILHLFDVCVQCRPVSSRGTRAARCAEHQSPSKGRLAGHWGSDLDCGVAEDHVEQPDVIRGVVLGYGVSGGAFGICESIRQQILCHDSRPVQQCITTEVVGMSATLKRYSLSACPVSVVLVPLLLPSLVILCTARAMKSCSAQ